MTRKYGDPWTPEELEQVKQFVKEHNAKRTEGRKMKTKAYSIHYSLDKFFEDESVDEIILRHYHGFTKKQWEENKKQFPYSEVPHIVESALKIGRSENEIMLELLKTCADNYDLLKEKNSILLKECLNKFIELRPNIPGLGPICAKLKYYEDFIPAHEEIIKNKDALIEGLKFQIEKLKKQIK